MDVPDEISIHAPREGSDRNLRDDGVLTEAFLSTLPVRGATKNPLSLAAWSAISIHAPREGSDLARKYAVLHPPVISIHAPREGSDRGWGPACSRPCPISIHAPREGSDSAPPGMTW